ncbi:hypothetical protein PINS_up013386 [Pythium insidiosum]|nr:hypothetical protein PINS_up013386 [Pythium insidiosum]
MGAPAHSVGLRGLRHQSAGASLTPSPSVSRLPTRVLAQTKYNYRYESTDRVGHWYQLSLENESGSHRVCGKTGDQTVPYHSLSWAHAWLGPSGTLVDITRVPQSVYFATERIKRVKALREASTHHADYSHSSRQRRCCQADKSEAPSLFDGLFGKSKAEHITFFETARVEQGQTWTVSGCLEISTSIIPLSHGPLSLPRSAVDERVGDRGRRTP